MRLFAKNVIRFDEYRNVVVHETTDPEVIIVEYEAHGTVITTGAPFQQMVIAVFRVQHGQIMSYRDYINPLPLMEALASIKGAAEAPARQEQHDRASA